MTTATIENFDIQSQSPDLGVDRANSVIRGAKVLQIGDLNDSRPWQVDMETLERVVELGNQPNKGIKARYKHPSMFGDSLGSHLGRWTNFRIEGDSVRADLTIAKSAFKSPDGDIGGYIMELAEEDPESFGVSLAAILDAAMFETKEEIKPLRIERLHAVDTVGEPAATRGGLFNALQKESEVTKEQNEKVAAEQPVEMAVEQQQPKVEFSVEKASELAKPYLENFGDQGAKWFLEGKDLLECFKEELEGAKKLIEALQSENVEVRSRLEAVLQNQGEQEPLSQSVELSEEDRKQAEFQEQVKRAKRLGLSESDVKWASLFAKK